MMSIFTSDKSMRRWPAIALAGGLALAMNLASATAQEQPTTPAVQTPRPDPPCKAVILGQRDEILRLNDYVAQQQQQIVRLQRALLEQAKRNAEPDIVKEAGGQPGQSWDYERNELRPAATPTTAPPKP